MHESPTNIGIFLIANLFDLYLMVLCVRLILAYSRANYFNPIIRFIITVTQPIIAPLRRYIPNYGGIEFSTLFFMVVLAIIKYLLISTLLFSIPNIGLLLIGAIFSCLKLTLNIFFYSILFGSILSFITPGETPLTQVLSQLALPILRPLKRIIPPIGGLDLSPIPALLALQILIRLL